MYGTLCRVKKTSIYLNAELDHVLARYATAHGISKAEAVRRAVASLAAEAPRPRITAIGVAEGPGDIAENDELYLLEGFGRD